LIVLRLDVDVVEDVATKALVRADSHHYALLSGRVTRAKRPTSGHVRALARSASDDETKVTHSAAKGRLATWR
jgi:hypothetical protein